MSGRRLVIVAVVALSAVGLGATAAAAPESARVTQQANEVTLKVWDIFYFPKQAGAAGATGRAYLAIDKAFMKKYPNVKVEHVGVPGTNFFTDLRKFVASRSGPDVVTNGGGSFPANAGFTKAMYPMYKLITPRMNRELGPYLKGESIGDEAHYSIPNVAGVYAFVYNKALFKRAGIANPPRTYAQLLASCKKLDAAGITPITNGFTGLAAADMFSFGTTNQVLSQPALVGWARFKLGWTDRRIVAALEYMQQMAEAGCFGDRQTAATRTDTDGFSAFVGGRGAMVFQGGNLTAASFSRKALKNIGVFAFPRLPTSVYPPGTPGAGFNGNWSIMNYTSACQTAWRYIEFFSSPEAQTIQWNVAGLLPVNSRARVRATNGFDRGQLALAANKYGHHGIGATTSAPEATLLGRVFSQLINGSLSADEVADQLQKQRKTVKPPATGKLPNPPRCVDGADVSG